MGKPGGLQGQERDSRAAKEEVVEKEAGGCSDTRDERHKQEECRSKRSRIRSRKRITGSYSLLFYRGAYPSGGVYCLPHGEERGVPRGSIWKPIRHEGMRAQSAAGISNRKSACIYINGGENGVEGATVVAHRHLHRTTRERRQPTACGTQ